MKNTIFITCTVIITLALTAFTYSNWNSLPINKGCSQPTIKGCSQPTKVIDPPTFFYNLSPLCKNTITKERMYNAKTISDLMPEYNMQENLNNNITSLRDVKIRIEEENVDDTKHKSEIGNGNSLSEEQINLLKSTDYSTIFFLEGYSVDNKATADIVKERYFNYHMAVVPENQASYKTGNTAFIDFFSTESQPTIAKIESGNLKGGKISFTITKAGTISNLDNYSTCGYASVDERMMELMNNLPDGWNVATNGKGEKVNQTLVFSYGQTGC